MKIKLVRTSGGKIEDVDTDDLGVDLYGATPADGIPTVVVSPPHDGFGWSAYLFASPHPTVGVLADTRQDAIEGLLALLMRGATVT